MSTPDSPRLHFRPVQESDVPDIFRLQGDAETMRYIRPPVPEIGEVQKRFLDWKSYAEKCPGLGVFILNWKENGAFAGYAVARHVDFDPNNPELEIGYVIDPAYWGQGLASEIVKPLCLHLIQIKNPSEIVAFTDVANLPSQKALLKNGFEDAGMRHVYGGDCKLFILKTEALV